MKKILLSTVALFGIAGTAVAADLPARMPVKAPPIMAPAFNWTGCYLGGYVGGAFAGQRNGGDVVVTDVGNAPRTFTYNGTGYQPHSWAYDLDSSIIGGGTLGCNWQPVGSAFVFGVEGEAGYMSLKGSAADPLSLGLDTVASTKVGDWYGMITGRLGFAADRALFYVKGGAAFVGVKDSIVDGCTVTPCGPLTVNLSNSTTKATWTAGGGIEWAFDNNWSVKGEYMYIGLHDSVTLTGASVPAGAGPWSWGYDHSGIHTAKIGLNYRFGGGPVVARY